MSTTNKILLFGIVVSIVVAYWYSNRPTIAMLTTGEPDDWATPPGSDMPSPTVAPPGTTPWRRAVIDAANDLARAKSNIISAGGSLPLASSTFVDRIARESGYSNRATLRLLLVAVRPKDTSLVRNRGELVAYQAYNIALDNLRNALDVLDAERPMLATTMPDTYGLSIIP